ncbi:MAG: hypothetical protein IIX80_05350 [Clostridia bacterium]|nr:hypothetical protein [Clostridia bacterium]
MKHILLIVLLLSVLCTSFFGCIQPVPSEPGTDPESIPESEGEGESESESEAESEPPENSWVDGDTNASAFLSGGIVDASKREYSYDEMVEDLVALSDRYEEHFSCRPFGTTADERTLYVCTLGNPNAQNSVIVSAGIHGREYLTVLLAMKQIEFYLTYYDSGNFQGASYRDLFENYCFYIVPMTNPDGIMISQEGISSVRSPELRAQIEAIYQKDLQDGMTGQTEIDKYLQYWKANARGVDLNRNFDALWEEYVNIKRPCFAQYKGPKAHSEPETQAMASLCESIENVRAVICLHSQGEVLYWNCGQEGVLAEDTYDFALQIANRAGYKLMTEQNNDASFSDWCALNKGWIAVTVETGVGLCPLDYEKFLPIWQDHYDLLPLTAFHFTYTAEQ